MLIEACIEEGINSGKRITGALEKLNMNKQHVGKILSDGTGDDPGIHYWKRLPDNRYAIHDSPEAVDA